MQSRFRKESLGGIDADAIATLISSAADVAMIVDAGGVIRELACDSREFEPAWLGRWVGQRWIDTVTVESRPKIQELLRDAATHEVPRGRHVNHPSSQGPDIPILYSTVRIGADGRVVAVGRDLRQAAELQQRLIEAQQSIERDYARLRHVETRYRLLFQITSEPVLIVDPASQKVVEANPAAGRLLGDTVRRIVGRPFPDGFDPQSTQAILALLAAVRASGQADSARVRLAHHGHEVQVSASLFRQESASLFLIRIVAADGETDTAAATRMNASLLKIVESAPDAFVVTGPDGRILSANASFLDLAQLGAEEQARGESLDRWLGRPGVDLNVLVANLRQHGSVRLFATTLRGEYGAAAEIEVSAVSVANGDQPCFGFTIRNIGRRLQADSRIGRELPRSVEQLTELVGRVPLKDLVRETTDVIERLCIEAALELTGDNRASAAEILGLSRQSLYVKLRRYGLGDLIAEGGGE